MRELTCLQVGAVDSTIEGENEYKNHKMVQADTVVLPNAFPDLTAVLSLSRTDSRISICFSQGSDLSTVLTNETGSFCHAEIISASLRFFGLRFSGIFSGIFVIDMYWLSSGFSGEIVCEGGIDFVFFVFAVFFGLVAFIAFSLRYPFGYISQRR